MGAMTRQEITMLILVLGALGFWNWRRGVRRSAIVRGSSSSGW